MRFEGGPEGAWYGGTRKRRCLCTNRQSCSFISSGYWKQINCLRSGCRGGQDFISKWFWIYILGFIYLFQYSMRAWQFLNPYPLPLKQQLRAKITQQPNVPCTEFGEIGEFLSQMYVSEAKWTYFFCRHQTTAGEQGSWRLWGLPCTGQPSPHNLGSRFLPGEMWGPVWQYVSGFSSSKWRKEFVIVTKLWKQTKKLN